MDMENFENRTFPEEANKKFLHDPEKLEAVKRIEGGLEELENIAELLKNCGAKIGESTAKLKMETAREKSSIISNLNIEGAGSDLVDLRELEEIATTEVRSFATEAMELIVNYLTLRSQLEHEIKKLQH